MKLGLIGAGNMASALARGIGEPVLVYDVDEAKARALAEELGGEAVGSNAELAERADVVVLCHKPKQLEEVASEVGGRASAVVSILAATGTERSAAAYPGAAIYRVALMGRTGSVIRLDDEPRIEPAMALMACGPGFLALVAETFADAGAAHGLDRDDAMRMVVETMGGTADYLARHGYDGPALRTRVATPGGTTEKGLIALEDTGLRDVTRAAVDAVVEATR